MATTNTWAQVVEKISGVANRGAFSKTFTPTTSSQSSTGAAGYYSSVSTTCNAVSLSGNAGVGNVLTGKTFYTTSLTKQTGTMANRGALNWSPTTSTSYTVSAGYYSGGTLKSSGVWSAAVAAADARVNTSSASYKSGVTAGKTSFGGISWTHLKSETIAFGENRDSISTTIPATGCNVIVAGASSVYDPNTPTPTGMTVGGRSCTVIRTSNNGGCCVGLGKPNETVVLTGTYNRGPQYMQIYYGKLS